MYLEQIVNDKKKEIETVFDDRYMKKIIKDIPVKRHGNIFLDSLKNGYRPAIIGEIKKSSPSSGVLKKELDVGLTAAEYDLSGVEALSILTEKKYFGGDISNIKEAKKNSGKPVLRKDFIIDLRQIYESAYIGADAVLLITSLLSFQELIIFQDVAKSLGLDCIVEVHNEEEACKAIKSGAAMIGINNRDLKTFKVSLETTMKIAPTIPEDIFVISESGIKSHEDISYLNKSGIGAVLAGEAFMRADSIIDAVRRIRYGDES